MGGEPTCPECGTTVLPDWDWCQGCGFDPDGLRPVDAAAPDPPAARRPKPKEKAKEAKAAKAARSPAVASPPVVGTTVAPLLDLDISQSSFGKKHLLVTRDRLVFGKDTVDFDQVTGYAWSIGDRRVHFEAPAGAVKVVFGEGGRKKRAAAAKAERADPFDRLVAICDEILVPRLTEETVARIRSGDALEVGNLVVSRDGFSVSTVGGLRDYPWTEFAGAHVQRGGVHVFVPSNERPQQVAEVSMDIVNGPLVATVMTQCAAALAP